MLRRKPTECIDEVGEIVAELDLSDCPGGS
jgi:hypothetical protein